MSGISNPADLTDTNAAIEDNSVLLAVIQAIVADTNVDLEVVDANVDLIRAVTDGLPTLSSAVGSTTTTVINTEYSLYINNAPLGVFKPVLVTVNFLNQTATETVILRKYRRDTDGGVWSLFDESDPIVGVQSPVLIGVNLGPNRFGVRLTIERTVGTARAYPWASFYEI